jgi:hypothetical protein
MRIIVNPGLYLQILASTILYLALFLSCRKINIPSESYEIPVNVHGACKYARNVPVVWNTV